MIYITLIAIKYMPTFKKWMKKNFNEERETIRDDVLGKECVVSISNSV